MSEAFPDPRSSADQSASFHIVAKEPGRGYVALHHFPPFYSAIAALFPFLLLHKRPGLASICFLHRRKVQKIDKLMIFLLPYFQAVLNCFLPRAAWFNLTFFFSPFGRCSLKRPLEHPRSSAIRPPQALLPNFTENPVAHRNRGVNREAGY